MKYLHPTKYPFFSLIIFAIWSTTFLLLPARADDKKPPIAKKRPSNVADVPSRALAKAKAHAFKVKRLTVTYDTSDDDSGKLLVVVEFENKQFGLYTGYSEPDDDQFIIIEPENLALVQEAMNRCK